MDWNDFDLNTDIIGRLRDAGIPSDLLGTAMIVLIMLKQDRIEFLDKLDDSSTGERMLILYQTLKRKGLIEDAEGTVYFKLTDKALKILDIQKVKTTTERVKDEVNKWIDEWIELWPKGVKSGGKLIRSDARSCLIKMANFLIKYPMYDKETIFKATNHYLNQKATVDYEYTRCAVYFISKQNEGSDLAAWCEQIKDGSEEPEESNHFI